MQQLIASRLQQPRLIGVFTPTSIRTLSAITSRPILLRMVKITIDREGKTILLFFLWQTVKLQDPRVTKSLLSCALAKLLWRETLRRKLSMINQYLLSTTKPTLSTMTLSSSEQTKWMRLSNSLKLTQKPIAPY